MKITSVQYVKPRFGSIKKTAVAALGTGLLAFAPLSDAQAQIPLPGKQPAKKVKQVEPELQIKSVKDLQEFKAALILQERKLAQSLLDWEGTMEHSVGFGSIALRQSEDKSHPNALKIRKVNSTLYNLREAFYNMREKHPPPQEDILTFKAITLTMARLHKLWTESCPKWNDPNAFGLQFATGMKFSWGGDPKDFKQEDAFKRGFDMAKKYAKEHQDMLKQRDAVLKMITSYDKAAKRLKQPVYSPYWGLNRQFITTLDRAFQPSAGKKKK